MMTFAEGERRKRPREKPSCQGQEQHQTNSIHALPEPPWESKPDNSDLSHTRENTANQNAGKPLYIRWYSTDPSYDTVRQFAIFSLVWNKIAIQ